METINEKVHYETEETSWFKRHKSEILVGTGVVVALVGGIIIFKKWDNVKKICCRKGILKKSKDNKTSGESTIEVLSIVKKVIPDDFVPSGILMTATELGNEVLCSAQVINKKLIGAGLVERWPDGSYNLTEEGKKIGKEIAKRNRYGYSFPNIEWDKNVLNLIFSKEEFDEINEKKAEILRIMEKIAAREAEYGEVGI